MNQQTEEVLTAVAQATHQEVDTLVEEVTPVSFLASIPIQNLQTSHSKFPQAVEVILPQLHHTVEVAIHLVEGTVPPVVTPLQLMAQVKFSSLIFVNNIDKDLI